MLYWCEQFYPNLTFIWVVCCLCIDVFGIQCTFLDTDSRIVIVHGSIAMPVTTRAGCTCDLTSVSTRTVRRTRRANMSADETVVPILLNY